ncbi:MAG: enoyl-CoA hydratase/isomerase family protein [Nanoarchaeota archaeon]|nr:enoyl-CoA hydratase/isomerase family protein [Nanoarchaeota archaeon]
MTTAELPPVVTGIRRALAYQSKDNSDLGILALSRPPVNAYDPAEAERISEMIRVATTDPGIGRILLVGYDHRVDRLPEKRVFSAGADIGFLAGDAPAEDKARLCAVTLYDALMTLWNSPKPAVAYVHGAALGGGLEIALAARTTFAHPDAKVGMPDINYGLVPAAGGVYFLMQRVGSEQTLDILARGIVEPAGEFNKRYPGVVELRDDPTSLIQAPWAFEARTVPALTQIDFDAATKVYPDADPAALNAVITLINLYANGKSAAAQRFGLRTLTERYRDDAVLSKLREATASKAK